MRIAQIQSHVYEDKQRNLDMLAGKLDRIDSEAVDLVTVGEMFTTPYETSCFPRYAEPEGGMSWRQLSDLAKKHGIYLSAGSIPEVDAEGRVYNTAYVFDREGRQIAKHRKAHLFDIDVEGGQRFRESDTLTAGRLRLSSRRSSAEWASVSALTADFRRWCARWSCPAQRLCWFRRPSI